MFALVYDVFYEAFAHFDGILAGILGCGYQLIPNFWVYHIGTSDQVKGFEPHRDAEYVETIGLDGMPTVLTLWVAVTDATPLNSCMYVVPRNRDPQYADVIRTTWSPRRRSSGWRTSARCRRGPVPSRAGTNTFTTGEAAAAAVPPTPASATPLTASAATSRPSATRSSPFHHRSISASGCR
jgi:hypothetical protein